jgi:hypothetical protein
MASNMKMADAMKTTTKVCFQFVIVVLNNIVNFYLIDESFFFSSLIFKTMEKMNKIQNPAETARIMQEFEKQNMKMGMTDEMSLFIFLTSNYFF